MRYKCRCGKTVRARAPKGGNGAALVPYAHDKPGTGDRCPQSFAIIEWSDLEGEE